MNKSIIIQFKNAVDITTYIGEIRFDPYNNDINSLKKIALENNLELVSWGAFPKSCFF